MINVQIGDNTYSIPEAREFTIADQKRIDAAAKEFKSEGIKYWAKVTGIPEKELKKLEIGKFKVAKREYTHFDELKAILFQQYEEFDHLEEINAFMQGEIKTIEIEGKTWNVPQDLEKVELGKIESCNAVSGVSDWDYLPLMLSIMLEREDWDYEEELEDPEKQAKAYNYFSKANVIQAISIHFFFRVQEQGYSIDLAGLSLQKLMKESGLDQEDQSLKTPTEA